MLALSLRHRRQEEEHKESKKRLFRHEESRECHRRDSRALALTYSIARDQKSTRCSINHASHHSPHDIFHLALTQGSTAQHSTRQTQGNKRNIHTFAGISYISQELSAHPFHIQMQSQRRISPRTETHRRTIRNEQIPQHQHQPRCHVRSRRGSESE